MTALCFAAALVNAATDDAHRYVVSIDASLETLRVEARFAAPVTRLRARSRSAYRYLERAADCDTGKSLDARGRTLELPGIGLSFRERCRPAAAFFLNGHEVLAYARIRRQSNDFARMQRQSPRWG